MFLCICKGITESDVQEIALHVPATPESLTTALGLHDEMCCGRCADEIDDFVDCAASALAANHAAVA